MKFRSGKVRLIAELEELQTSNIYKRVLFITAYGQKKCDGVANTTIIVDEHPKYCSR